MKNRARTSRPTLTCALALVLVCGSAVPLAARAQQQNPDQEENAQPDRPAIVNSQDFVNQRAEQSAQQNAPDAQGNRPLNQQIQPQRPGAGAGRDPAPPINDDEVLLDFPGQSIEITAFIEYVGQTLDINIIIKDEGLANQRVTFQSAHQIPKDELLTLLTAIVEDKGYALTRDALDFYIIEQGLNVEPIFDQDEFSTTRLFRTPLVKPSGVQGPVQAALGGGSQVRFTAFDDLGILMATASPKTLDTIEALLSRILSEIAGQELTRYQLVNVSAEFARQRILVLNGAIAAGGQTALGGGGGQGAQPTSGTSVIASSLANLEQRLIIDSGNALIFRGSGVEADLVRQLIDMVDQIVRLEVRRYVVGGTVGDVAELAQQLGLGSVRSGQGGGAPGGGSLVGGRPGAQGVAPATEVSGSYLSIDEELGTITYFGTASQHEIFQTIVDEFTAEQIDTEVEIRMYKLENTEAVSVQTVLEELISDPQQDQLGSSPFLPGSRQGAPGFLAQDLLNQLQQDVGLDGQGEQGFDIRQENVVIVADEDRNQIVIKATPREHRQLERVIEDLDQRQPQVYIEAQIVSIVSNDNFNWAIETQLNSGQFLLFTNLGLSEPATDSDGQPTGNKIVPAGAAGLTTALIRNDYVPFIINTLQEETNARLQSTPRILVRDNETGDVASQREEPFSTTSQGTATSVTSQGGTASAGTTLNVTPRISSGGYLTLEYSIEVSSFQGTGTAGLQPPRQTENYSSIVQVPSDSTIVVGGFTLESESNSESGVPILKDIPLLGILFKTVGQTKQRTTIYVFITPRIMTDENFLDLRLATEGPMNAAGIEGNLPELEPAVIPIRHGTSSNLSRSAWMDQPPAPSVLLPESPPANATRRRDASED